MFEFIRDPLVTLTKSLMGSAGVPFVEEVALPVCDSVYDTICELSESYGYDRETAYHSPSWVQSSVQFVSENTGLGAVSSTGMIVGGTLLSAYALKKAANGLCALGSYALSRGTIPAIIDSETHLPAAREVEVTEVELTTDNPKTDNPKTDNPKTEAQPTVPVASPIDLRNELSDDVFKTLDGAPALMDVLKVIDAQGLAVLKQLELKPLTGFCNAVNKKYANKPITENPSAKFTYHLLKYAAKKYGQALIGEPEVTQVKDKKKTMKK